MRYLDTSLGWAIPDIDIFTCAADYQSASLPPPATTQQAPLSVGWRLSEIRTSNIQS